MSSLFDLLRRRYAWFGLAGAFLVSACILISALAYNGQNGESYSLSNQFISELGEVRVSELAWLFNTGLILGGLLFLPFALGLGLALPGWVAKLGAVAGFIAALSLTGVGIFPMNIKLYHAIAATTYFRAGLATVLLFGLAIQLQPKNRVVIDKRANLISLLAVGCYSAFLFYIASPAIPGAVSSGMSWLTSRPDFIPMALLEWSIFFATVAWFFILALAGKGERGQGGKANYSVFSDKL